MATEPTTVTISTDVLKRLIDAADNACAMSMIGALRDRDWVQLHEASEAARAAMEAAHENH